MMALSELVYAIAALMAANRPSAEIAAELEALNAAFEATRNAPHTDLHSQFGCHYRGGT